MNRMEPIEFAKHRCQSSNSYEDLMWQLLRNRQRCNKKFRRQHPLGIYTADFFCAEEKMVIEIDGADHSTPAGQAHDRARDAWMHSQGIRVLRFTGKQVDLRDTIRNAAGETLDLKPYEADMRHLIDAYIEASEPRKISPFDNNGLLDLIVNTGIAAAIAEKLNGLKGDRDAIAETIENNVAKRLESISNARATMSGASGTYSR